MAKVQDELVYKQARAKLTDYLKGNIRVDDI
jgi:hypothetical protein